MRERNHVRPGRKGVPKNTRAKLVPKCPECRSTELQALSKGRGWKGPFVELVCPNGHVWKSTGDGALQQFAPELRGVG